MRLSQSFGKTLREAPSDAELMSHQLLIRGNFVRPLGAGIYTYMPLGFRVLRNIEKIMADEMDAISGQQMLMPNLHPRAIWDATGRWEEMSDIMMRIDAGGSREYGMSPTHEEVVVDTTAREVESYRDLPQMIYHISKKFRDEARPRGGMLRLREFIMKDAYSMHISEADLDDYYPSMVQAYLNIFKRCGIDIIQVDADTGAMGGKTSHEFLVRNEDGEDTFIECDSCGYAANVEAALFKRTGDKPETLDELVKVETPDCKTIADVANFVGVPTSQTLKAVFYWATPLGKEEKDGRLVFAVVRGDLDVNDVKLANALGGAHLRAATEEEIQAKGAVPGYASPIGLTVAKTLDDGGLNVVADSSIEAGGNFVFGANDEGYHFTGANYPRDFSVTILADIAEADNGHICGSCGDGTLVAQRAIEAGHCFKLGLRYSEPTNTTALGEDGKPKLVYMGSYGIGLDRLMAIIVEEHHDKDGVLWPPEVAPYDVHLMHVGRGEEPIEVAEKLYKELQAAGFSVLYDDRQASPGVKFKDADLMGMPVRVAVGQRGLQEGGVEVKWRHESDRSIVPLDELIASLQK
ncbi:MAG: proline--tRNA ligase [Anaerolineales bacterium]|nr:proline--tRNA ligase [Anaerolineales bacterium]